MSKSITIGSAKLRHGLILAPMAGVTDYAFRTLCRRMGAEYVVSEMVSAKAVCYGDKKTASLTRITFAETPMAIQLFGSDPEFVAKAAAIIEEQYAGSAAGVMPSAIDINMGCPVNKIAGNGEGSALMKNIPLAAKIIYDTVCATSIPVTVKFRSGWDSDNINAAELAKAAQDSGAAAVCVHGRTRTQMYSGNADYSIISKVKQSVKIPVIGNGDIYCASDAIRMANETGCDAVMVARGAMGNPWIFDEIRCALEGLPFTPPTIEERVKTALSHVQIMIDDKGAAVAINEARKHLAWYIKGYPGAAGARAKINSALSMEQLCDIMSELL